MQAGDLTTPVFSQAREPVGEMELPAEIFGQPVRRHLLYEVVKMQMANRRGGTASTKTRGEVRGGGRKPWRQKGTGRARAGSTRSPLWVGGGTVFGPRPRSYSYRMPRQARRAALWSALSLKRRDGRLVVVDKLELAEVKTRRMAEVLGALAIEGSVLIVFAERNEGVEKAARNLPGVKVLAVDGLNVYDLLRYRNLVLTREGVQRLGVRLSS